MPRISFSKEELKYILLLLYDDDKTLVNIAVKIGQALERMKWQKEDEDQEKKGNDSSVKSLSVSVNGQDWKLEEPQ